MELSRCNVDVLVFLFNFGNLIMMMVMLVRLGLARPFVVFMTLMLVLMLVNKRLCDGCLFLIMAMAMGMTMRMTMRVAVRMTVTMSVIMAVIMPMSMTMTQNGELNDIEK